MDNTPTQVEIIRDEAIKDYAIVTDCARAAVRHHDREADLEAIASIHNVIHYAEQAQRASVALARAEGHGWLAIGMALGVSKQAAQQKYGNMHAKDDTSGSQIPVEMLNADNFDDQGNYYPNTIQTNSRY